MRKGCEHEQFGAPGELPEASYSYYYSGSCGARRRGWRVEGGGAPILVTVALHRDGGAKGSPKAKVAFPGPLLFRCPWRPFFDSRLAPIPRLGCPHPNETKWATRLELTGGGNHRLFAFDRALNRWSFLWAGSPRRNVDPPCRRATIGGSYRRDRSALTIQQDRDTHRKGPNPYQRRLHP